jgi:predicted lipoprotein with Yx(FWY)xxD motif
MGFTPLKRSTLTAGFAVVAAAGALGTGIALAAGTHQASAVTIGVKRSSLGTILYAGPDHRTVYMFTKDRGTRSACIGACAGFWPAVTTMGRPRAGPGLVARELGTVKQAGVTQVTYKGHPLYFYTGDTRASSIAGQGLMHTWFALSASGAKVTKRAPSGSGSTSSGQTTTTSPGMVGTTPGDVQWS